LVARGFTATPMMAQSRKKVPSPSTAMPARVPSEIRSVSAVAP
jgi:hypothetical protein